MFESVVEELCLEAMKGRRRNFKIISRYLEYESVPFMSRKPKCPRHGVLGLNSDFCSSKPSLWKTIPHCTHIKVRKINDR